MSGVTNNLPPHVLVIWGQEGSWKTSMALTYPKPLRHLETDVGGFNRAAWRIDTEGIDTTTYAPPLQIEESKKVSIKFPRRLIGYKELWQKIFLDYIKAVRDEKIKTIVIDSATELWTLCHRGYLQEIQESQIAMGTKDHAVRENLMPVEYADPNARMRQLINAGKSYGKYLVLTHYPKDEYVTVRKGEHTESMPSGKLIIDGFKDTKKLIDIVVWLELNKKGEANATVVEKCAMAGMGSTALGMELPEPSYQGLVDLRNMLMGE